ncbi:hypothetical protein FHW88_005272 [Mucilaginibacter sp. SG538B]|uniref:hypothetical protein n=1 Tax=Mucilaginibacter sp. SG538B TaxID=2587021 RepID=UPI00159DF140|nr:hypothetical protein [Mucilaginibacter sp. SG538B]NVM66954.1 hypothetical protein [Mucilaginibacter sp. SG538B]
MDQKIVTLIISIVAILATLTSSLVGHYFTAKARTSSFKQLLYGRQVDLLIRIMQKQGSFKIYASLLIPGEVDYREQARKDGVEILKEYSALSEEAAAIIPSELWGGIRDCCRSMSDLIEQFDRGELNSKDKLLPFTAINVKVGLMIRSFIGADKLSYESVALFETKKDLQRITKMEISSFVEMPSNKNASV